MNRNVIITLVFGFFILCVSGCERTDNGEAYRDPAYPTTLYKLNTDTLLSMRATYTDRNRYLNTSINDFGFSDLRTEDLSPETPPSIEGELTKEEAIEIIKNFITANTRETGIENPEDVTFRKAFSSPINNTPRWRFVTNYQRIDTIEVIQTWVYFNITNREIVYCIGNWYPSVYIPEQFRVDIELAKKNLLGQRVAYSDFVGNVYYQFISFEDLDSAITTLSIVPLETDTRVELRVAWKIWMDSLSYIIYVDVMTGKIVYKECLVIS